LLVIKQHTIGQGLDTGLGGDVDIALQALQLRIHIAQPVHGSFRKQEWSIVQLLESVQIVAGPLEL